MDIFKIDTIENAGDNWLIADFGYDDEAKKTLCPNYKSNSCIGIMAIRNG